jgi:two-component system chemotaxis sensor kinase CheA
MDVVKKATESIGGKIAVDTEPGKGSKIILSLPSSMAVKGALLFEMNHQEYAIALAYTEAVISLYKKDIHKVSNGLISTYLDKTVSLVFLHDIFELEDLENRPDGCLHRSYGNLAPNQKLDVIIVSYNGRQIGIVVDKLLQQKEIVEKTLMKPLDNVGLFSGATLLGNGNVCLVLDIVSIVGVLFKELKTTKQLEYEV